MFYLCRRFSKVIHNANKLQKYQVIYVGDETRDIRSARRSKIGIAAVTWGFNSAAILQEYQPDYLVNRPQQLLDVIKLYSSNSPQTTVS